jgi:hypothetical protein
MSLYILSHPRLRKSARPLAVKLSALIGEEIKVSTYPLRNSILLVRYGNSQVNLYEPNETEYNSPDMIMLAGNKRTLSNYLEKDKEIQLNHIKLCTGIPEVFPVVVRKELNRGGGIGIEIYENRQDFITDYRNWPNPYPWSTWYPFEFELGVHILGGEIKKVFKKLREENLPEEKYPIRNTQRGYKFVRKNPEVYSGLKKFVDSLYKIIPIKFARLDVGYNKNMGGWRLIEINSAPDLSQNANTLELYAEYLFEEVRKEKLNKNYA